MQQLETDELCYDAWQSQLLQEMGITRWVSQHSPVLTLPEDFFDNNTDVAVISAKHDVVAHLEGQLNNEISPDTITVSQVKLNDSTAISATSHPTQDWQDITDDLNEQNYTESTVSLPVLVEKDAIVVARFALQIIVVQEWILIVDTNYLQQDQRQAALWEQIIANLKAAVHFFNFPLLEKIDHLSPSAIHTISNQKMAMAGFCGFIFSLSKGQDFKIGSLTRLPDYLEDDRIQRLPYLSEMLEDYRIKRQLWLLLTA